MTESNIQHLVDKKGRLWQERTILVNPNKANGYGFSLSGERPVYVGSIVDEGPAYQAGIRRNDRIIKVDGNSVFDKKHDEVVILLKGAASVSLTIIRVVNPTRNSTKESNYFSTAPGVIQELTVNNLKSMLLKQQRHFEQLTTDYTRGSSPSLEKELKDCEEIIRSLMGEIAVKTNSSVETVSQSTEGVIGSLLGPRKAIDRVGRLARDDSMLAHKILSTMSITNDTSGTSQSTSTPEDGDSGGTPITKRSTSPTKFKSPKSFRRSSISKLLSLGTSGADVSPNSGSSSPTKGLQRSMTELNDSDLSDEDLEFGVPQFGPFSSLQELNNYPAHMSVFLHFLIQNQDPRYLCFYLVARSYQNVYKGNDLRQKAMEILWTFCLSTSPLYVPMSDGVLQRILETLDVEDNEIKLKSIFVEARDVVANQIADDLTQFRQKRTLGLGSMYGEQKLTDHMTSSREVEVSYSTLGKVVKAISNEKCDDMIHSNRNQALCDSLTTFLTDVGKGKSKSEFTVADKGQSFTKIDPNKRSKKIKKISKCGHSLQLTGYTQTTLCDHCERVLWGVGYQGYQCIICEMNFHRFGCADDRLDSCKREKRTSRKSSGNTTSSIVPLSDMDRDKDRGAMSDDHEMIGEEEEQRRGVYRSRLRSVSDPKNTLMGIQPMKDEDLVKEKNLFHKKPKTSATVSRTQSLKERTRSGGGDSHPQSSQDTSLTTTPSWNSVASSTSDESLNTSTGATYTGVAHMPKSSTLDTVIEGGDRVMTMEEHILQELQEANVENELVPWRLTTKSQIVKRLLPFEIQRQEILKELIHTERTHRKKLLIMKHIYKTPLCRQKIITYQQAEQLFPSLEEIIDIHNDLCDDMRARQSQYADSVVREMGDILLDRFEGEAGEKLCKAIAVFAANQTKAMKYVKEFSKNPKFKKFVLDAESDPYCNRLKLQELVPIVWTRLTRYQLLMDNICKLNRKNKDKLKEEDKPEAELMETALVCLRNVCKYVNKQVKQSENLRHLREFQSRLDTSPLDRTTHPIAEKYKDLNLTAENRKLLHEGILHWKITHRKTIEVRALLLTDILVLLHKMEDGSERLLLKMCHVEGISGVRDEISPVIRLKEMLFRDRADRVGRTFLIVNHSSLLKLAQMYEFTAESVQEKKKWEKSIENATSAALGNGGSSSPEPHSPGGFEDSFPRPVIFTPLMSNVTLRDQLDKIDDEIQKLMEDKLTILKALQGDRRDSAVLTLTPPADKDFDGVRDYSCGVLETVSDVTNQVSKLMVPNPTKHIVADVQYQLTELSSTLHRNLSHVVVYLSESMGGTNDLSLNSAGSNNNIRTGDQYSPVLEGKVNETASRYENISDTTVSPMEDSSISTHVTDNTPQATPLPNDDYRLHPVAPDIHSTTGIQRQGHLEDIDGDVPQYSQEEDEDGDAPPIPLEPPPPSSTSASSQTTNPDLDDFLPAPKLPHSLSSFSEDFQVDSVPNIVDPPEGFLSSSPNKARIFTIPKEDLSEEEEEEEDEEDGVSDGRKLPQSSPPKNTNTNFRRVRSNPSLSSLKVKMSVISSSGSPVSSNSNMNLEMSAKHPANNNDYHTSVSSTQSKLKS